MIVAVGKKANRILNEMGMVVAAAVKHPANGGDLEFARGMQALP
jgi:sorbitol-specific phosphotransferase system component IIA